LIIERGRKKIAFGFVLIMLNGARKTNTEYAPTAKQKHPKRPDAFMLKSQKIENAAIFVSTFSKWGDGASAGFL
jgi:hypothetical protein